MKILRVSGTNITTFDHFEIDFQSEPLASCGLFAITGATGSGKSTLLDAICLAFYGRTPRYSGRGGMRIGRDDEIEKNKLTSNDPKALLSYGAGFIEVEVDFTRDHSQFYRAKWYAQKAHKKPEGVIQGATHTLYEIKYLATADGQKRVEEKLLEGPNRKEAQAKIEQTVGLKYDEFCRTVFLAQGEFDAFLKREEERASLLELLTGDELYSKISQLASEKLKEAEHELSKLRADIDEGLLDDDELEEVNTQFTEVQETLKVQRSQQRKRQSAEYVMQDLYDRLHDYLQLHTDIAQQQASQVNINIEQAVLDLYEYKDLLNLEIQIEQNQIELKHIAQEMSSKKAESQEITRKAQSLLQEKSEKQKQLDAKSVERQHHQLKRSELTRIEEKLANAETILQHIKDEKLSVTNVSKQAQKEIADYEQALVQATINKDKHNAWIASQGHLRRLVKHQDQWTQLFQQLQDIEHANIDSNQQLSQLDYTHQTLQKNLGDLEQQWLNIENQRQTLSTQVQQLENKQSSTQLNELKLKHEQSERLKTNVVEAKRLLDELNGELNHIIEYQNKKKTHELRIKQQQEKVLEERVNLKILSARLEESKFNLKLTESETLLSELRESLSPDKPCPLCGSKDHSLDQIITNGEEIAQYQTRVQELKVEHTQLETHLKELQEALTKEEQEVHWYQKQVQEDTTRIQDKLRRWSDLNSDRAWREAIERDLQSTLYSELKHYSRLVLSDLLTEMELNTSLFQALTQGLEHLSNQVQQEATEYNDAMMKIILDQRQLSTFKEELVLAEQKINQYEDTKNAYNEDLLHLIEVKNKLAEELESRQLAASQIIQTLSEFSPDSYEYLNIREVLSQQKDWLLHCQEWQKRESEQFQRLQEISRKQQEFNQVSALFESSKTKLVELSQQEEKQKAEVNQIKIQHTQLKTIVDQTLEGDQELQTLRSALESYASQIEQLKHQETQHSFKLGELTHKETVLRSELSQQAERKKSLFDCSALSKDELIKALALWREINVKELETAIQDQKNFAQTLQESVQKLEHFKQTLTDKQSQLPAEYKLDLSLTVESQEKLKQALKKLKHEHKQNMLQIEQLLLSEAQAKGKLSRHQEALSKQGDESDEVKLAIAEANHLRSMVKTLGGTGKHIGFNAFAQKYTLEMIIDHANYYLEQLMSRYQLEMIKDDKKPLNFQVIDLDLGEEARSINSLSGGESFLISLALALGLSSTSSQNTHIESLFIDEGFGTLDPDSLDLALTMLDNLQVQGIQIGIISHVEGIAERIGTQINVQTLSAGKSKLKIHQSFQDPY